MISSNTARSTWKNKCGIKYLLREGDAAVPGRKEFQLPGKEKQIMSYAINFLMAYLIIAAVLFVIYTAAAFLMWEETKKNIYSDPAEVLVFCAVISLFWAFFIKSFVKGVFSSR